MLLLFKIIYPYKIIGRENMPASGRTMLCPNHGAYADPFFAACAVSNRQLHFMAKSELFTNKLIGGFLKSLGAFPVSRGTGGAEGVQTALRLIEEEEVVCLFPEGTRSEDGQLLKLKTGAALLAARTNCVIVPMAIVGKDGRPPKLFGRMILNIGKPLTYEDLGLNGSSPAGYRNAIRVLTEHITELRQEGIDILAGKGKAA